MVIILFFEERNTVKLNVLQCLNTIAINMSFGLTHKFWEKNIFREVEN